MDAVPGVLLLCLLCLRSLLQRKKKRLFGVRKLSGLISDDEQLLLGPFSQTIELPPAFHLDKIVCTSIHQVS